MPKKKQITDQDSAQLDDMPLKIDHFEDTAKVEDFGGGFGSQVPSRIMDHTDAEHVAEVTAELAAEKTTNSDGGSENP